MSENITITVEYVSTRMLFDSNESLPPVAIGEAKGVDGSFITIKGEPLEHGLTYRLFGHWSEYNNRRTGRTEKQFHYSSSTQCQPYSQEGTIAYLSKLGAGYGVGRSRARRLYELFGSKAIEVAKSDPARAADAIPGWSAEEAKSLAELLRDRERLEAATVEVNEILDKSGLPKSLPTLVIREWGVSAASKIKEDPYILLAFPRCGFKLVDKLYLRLGGDRSSLRRQALCAWYAIDSDSEGHTWYSAKWVQSRLVAVVGSAAEPSKAINECIRIGREGTSRHGSLDMIRSDNDDAIIKSGGSVWLADSASAKDERLIAKRCVSMFGEPAVWPDPDAIDGLSDHQKSELKKAFAGGSIAILGGSPGTGKTYTAACLIRELAREHGADGVVIAAPTGKAAVRLNESMAGYKVPVAAKTWHSTLGVASSSISGGWEFQHNEYEPIPAKVIIGDESSMVDAGLMASVFRAINCGTKFLLVGDINQLPPVGSGAPLRDMIAAGIPYGELREIRRNSGGIVEACAAIRDGERWEPGDNLHLCNIGQPQRQIKEALNIIRDAESRGIDPVWDCQVLVSVNEKSPLSRSAMNEVLQRELNHNEKTGGKFAVGDKVINTRNGFFSLYSVASYGGGAIDAQDMKQNTFVANGELGRVVAIDPKSRAIYVEVFNPSRIVRATISQDSESSMCPWELGYAITVHKSQGSQWREVVVMLDKYPGAMMVGSREHLYTAISRAESRCYLVGDRTVADRSCTKSAIAARKTFLASSIRSEVADMYADSLL